MIWRATGGGLVLPDGRCDVFLTRAGSGWVPVVSGPGLAPFDAKGTDWIGVRLPAEAGGHLPPEIRAGQVWRGQDACAAIPALRGLSGPDDLQVCASDLCRTSGRTAWLRPALAAIQAGDRPGSVAHAAGLSPRRFRHAILETTGLTPSTLHALGRFHRALRLMRAGLPLAEVAVAAGFADQSHLTRACRRWGGFTPGRLPDVSLPGLPA